MKNLIVAFFTVAASYAATAQKPAIVTSDKEGWHKIAETTVDFSKDRDEVMVMGADRFAKLKFKVADAPIDLQDLQIFYENETKEDVQVRTPVQAGGESRVIDLKGAESSLKKIVFVYKTLENRNDEKGKVEIWGLKTNEVKSKSDKNK